MRLIIDIDRTPGIEKVTGHAWEYNLALDEDKLRGILVDALEILTDQRAKRLTCDDT